jgi:hypothetical protein
MNALELGRVVACRALIKDAAGRARAMRMLQSRNPAARSGGQDLLRKLEWKSVATPGIPQMSARYEGLDPVRALAQRVKRTKQQAPSRAKAPAAQPAAAQPTAAQPAVPVATASAETAAAQEPAVPGKPLLHGISEGIGNAVARGAYHLDPRLESGLLRMFGGANRGAMNLGAATLGAAPSLYYMLTDPYYGLKTDQYASPYGYPPLPRM